MTMTKPLRILLLSSRPIGHSASLGGDILAALEQAGHWVDFWNYPMLDPAKRQGMGMRIAWRRFRLRQQWERISLKLRRRLRGLSPMPTGGTMWVHGEDAHPPISTHKLLNELPNKEYDLVITLFWQDMLTAESLRAIYERLHAPILIYGVDMFPLTGGCGYFGTCTGYRRACGCCEALGSSNPEDITHQSWLHKRSVYSSIPCAYMGNSWMLERARESGLFTENQLKKGWIVINGDHFCEQSRAEARERLGVASHKRFVLFAGAQNLKEERKGFRYLIEGVNHFARTLSKEECAQVVILLAGRKEAGVDYSALFEVEVQELGLLDRKGLVDAYSAADCYLSPSIDDAGPSMVNQSLMCSTPVVCFSTGVALDLVEEGISGYRAPLKESESFGRGISSIFRLSDEAYQKLRIRARERAEACCSFAGLVRAVEEAYADLVDKK